MTLINLVATCDLMSAAGEITKIFLAYFLLLVPYPYLDVDVGGCTDYAAWLFR